MKILFILRAGLIRRNLLTTILFTTGCLVASLTTSASQPNIIYIVGDGMGAPYISAYRYFMHNGKPLPVRSTQFDQWMVGSAQTYPHDDTYVTDSAAAATALAAGLKTYNGAIGVNKQQQSLETVLERAKALNYQTAMVVTSAVTHATPASFAAHVASRHDAERIADQYLDQKINGKLKVDLLLGGGKKYFERADRNLLAEFKDAGYSYIDELSALGELTRLPALGLFADDGLSYALDSKEPLRLAKMTEQALKLLAEQPFFMLIEASQIDWCGHANDIACAMAEMHDLHQTLEILNRFISQHSNTLLVMTADHNTGGLTLGANNEYIWRTGLIHGIKKTAQPLAEALLTAYPDWQPVWQTQTALPLTDSIAQQLTAVLAQAKQLGAKPQNDKTARQLVVAEVLSIINQATATGWTTFGHTGEDVLVFAHGKHADQFKGNFNNSDIAERLFGILGK